MNPDDPVRVIRKIRNNRLQSWRESLGLKPREAAQQCGIGYGTYLQIEGLKHYPSKEIMDKICTATGMSHSYLFPDYFKSVATTVAVTSVPEEVFVSLNEAPQHLLLVESTAQDSAEARNLEEIIESLLCTLPKRADRILRKLYGLCGEEQLSCQEVADEFHISRARTWQIAQRAIRILRSRASHYPILQELFYGTHISR